MKKGILIGAIVLVIVLSMVGVKEMKKESGFVKFRASSLFYAGGSSIGVNLACDGGDLTVYPIETPGTGGGDCTVYVSGGGSLVLSDIPSDMTTCTGPTNLYLYQSKHYVCCNTATGRKYSRYDDIPEPTGWSAVSEDPSREVPCDTPECSVPGDCPYNQDCQSQQCVCVQEVNIDGDIFFDFSDAPDNTKVEISSGIVTCMEPTYTSGNHYTAVCCRHPTLNTFQFYLEDSMDYPSYTLQVTTEQTTFTQDITASFYPALGIYNNWYLDGTLPFNTYLVNLNQDWIAI